MTRRRTLIAALVAAVLGTVCSASTLETIRWRSVDVSPDQRGLVVRYLIDRCQEVDHAEVSYDPNRVLVTLLTKRTGVRCRALLFPKALVVPLHESLDGRRVEDGGT